MCRVIRFDPPTATRKFGTSVAVGGSSVLRLSSNYSSTGDIVCASSCSSNTMGCNVCVPFANHQLSELHKATIMRQVAGADGDYRGGSIAQGSHKHYRPQHGCTT